MAVNLPSIQHFHFFFYSVKVLNHFSEFPMLNYFDAPLMKENKKNSVYSSSVCQQRWRSPGELNCYCLSAQAPLSWRSNPDDVNGAKAPTVPLQLLIGLQLKAAVVKCECGQLWIRAEKDCVYVKQHCPNQYWLVGKVWATPFIS